MVIFFKSIDCKHWMVVEEEVIALKINSRVQAWPEAIFRGVESKEKTVDWFDLWFLLEVIWFLHLSRNMPG